jgi:hypothetical protein
MGSYAGLYFGGLYLGGDKGGINPLMMTLFRESDKRILEVAAGDPQAKEYASSYEIDDTDSLVLVQYRCSAAVVKDRLELMGFTLEIAFQAFEIARQQRLASFEDYEKSLGDHGHQFAEPLQRLRELTVSSWQEALRTIRARNLKPTYRSDPACGSYSPILRYMLCDHGLEWYGYPGTEIRHVIRLAIEAFGEDAELVYDLTELVEGGYYDTADDLNAHAAYLLEQDFLTSRRIVVLTEGATDKWILERSLRLLYPHLADYFAFMDFEGSRVAGGAGALANIVKAFVGAGIINRTVALFDNDTAAAVALRSLDNVALPSHIAAFRFPDLELAGSYPTLGPTGVVHMNVNGLAGSIELYLGLDVLSGADGLTPIQWKGYDGTVKAYQGEILNKSELHAKFRRKLAICEDQPRRISDFDWNGLRAILDQLRTVFQAADSAILLDPNMT